MALGAAWMVLVCRFVSVFLLVMAKTPLAGEVKTRLCPPCTPQQAADLAMAALLDTLDAALASGADEVVLALAGEPGCWVPSKVRVIPQRGHGFDERLANAWCDVGGPAFQIGMDTPQLDARILDDAMAQLDGPDVGAALGPADDGGWWGIGLRRPDPRVFLGVPMSSDRTCEAQFARLRHLGLAARRLGVLTDVDTIDDARLVAADHPCGRFGAQLASYEFPDP